MSLKDLLAVEHVRLAPQYAARRADYTALSPYPTLRDLVRKLTHTPRRRTKKQMEKLWQERAAILCVLVEAYQRDRDRLWEALVLTALTPMLSIVRRRFTGADPDEREGLFLVGVSAVLRTIDPWRKPDKIFGILWMKTKKRVTPKLRKEQEWAGVGVDIEADEVADESMPHPEEYVLVDIVSEANGGATVRARVPVGVLALARRRIEAYVGREFGGLPAADQRALYERLGALKQRCKGQEGKTAPCTPRTRRRTASVPPESRTRLRDDAPIASTATPPATGAEEVGS